MRIWRWRFDDKIPTKYCKPKEDIATFLLKSWFSGTDSANHRLTQKQGKLEPYYLSHFLLFCLAKFHTNEMLKHHAALVYTIEVSETTQGNLTQSFGSQVRFKKYVLLGIRGSYLFWIRWIIQMVNLFLSFSQFSYDPLCTSPICRDVFFLL